MTIVLLGADGQLANDLGLCFAGDALVRVGRRQLDITDEKKLSEVLRSVCPSIVLNAAAYNRVDEAEEKIESAFATNALALLHLSRLCEELGCVLVHYSTDYVFGNSPARRAWTETDLPAPLNVYGASKLCGESFVQAYCQRHFIIRTSGLFGLRPSGTAKNFVEAILSAAERTPRIRVVTEQTSTPSYTADVAEVTKQLVETGAYGKYHVTNAGQCTWFEFAAEILRQSRSKAQCIAITSAEYGARARRPQFSVLSNAKLATTGIPHSPPWQDGLARYLRRRASIKVADS
jgi:dTDP-4-dehydrorhamnose reductase